MSVISLRAKLALAAAQSDLDSALAAYEATYNREGTAIRVQNDQEALKVSGLDAFRRDPATGENYQSSEWSCSILKINFWLGLR